MANPAIEHTPTGPNVLGSIETADGFIVESNFETPAELKKSHGIPDVAADPDAAAAVEEPPQRRPRRNRDPRLAVETAVGKQREAERLAAESAERTTALEAEIAELKRPKPIAVVEPPKPVVAPAPQPPPPMAAAAAPPVTDAVYKRYQAMPDAPKMDAFTGDNAWLDYQYALNLFIADKRFDERMAQQTQQQEAQRVHTAFTERWTAAKTRIPDFETRFKPDTPVDSRVFPHIQRLENAPDVMLYLSDNPSLAQEITLLHPVEQIGKIGEISGMLKAQDAAASTAASARPAAISQARPVTKRVTGAPPAATDEPPGDDASEEQYEAYWGPRRASSHRRHR